MTGATPFEGAVRALRLLLAWAVIVVSSARSQTIVPNSSGAESVTFYAAGASGNVQPTRTLAGGATGLDVPFAVAVDTVHRELYVANFFGPSITVYSLRADGDQPPLRTLAGAATQMDLPIGMFVDTVHDELVVRDMGGNEILIFLRTADGNVPPLRVLTGAATGLLGSAVDLDVDLAHDELVVANRPGTGETAGILVFARTATGNIAPLRAITGPATGLGAAYGVAVDAEHDEIFATSDGSVRVFARMADGNIPPLRVLEGANTGLSAGATGIHLDPPTGEIHVTIQAANAVRVFDRLQQGDTPPLRSIAGLETGLSGPTLLAVGPSIFEDGFEVGDFEAWSTTVP